MKKDLEYYTGCILGGAIGDALGAPIEFLNLSQIIDRYGENGVTQYVEYPNSTGEITDDTQMLLFTAEGLLRATNRMISRGVGGSYTKICHKSYQRWLQTQQDWYAPPIPSDLMDGWLIKQKGLYKRRAPGTTCLSALSSGNCGRIQEPINNSKGCGGIMRIAPVGLICYNNQNQAFTLGAELAAITHTHPSGYLSAGALASIIALLNNGKSLSAAIDQTKQTLITWDDHQETLSAIDKALNLFENTKPTYENVEKVGRGWVAEEALSISLYCALHHEHDFESAINLAINHGGDSDSTGSITGNIVGLINGEGSIPKSWIENLQMEDIIRQIAIDLYTEMKGDGHSVYDKEWDEKYPGY